MAVHVVGGGLAGSEAAWQAATAGVRVVLHEMRPVRPTAVHKTDHLAELVCSNSLRGDKLDNAVGLLKEEMRRLGLAGDAARPTRHRVPAGAALAVDREGFSQAITDAVGGHPRITVVREEVARDPGRPDDVPAGARDRPADERRAVGGHRARWSAAITCISTTPSARSSWPRRSTARRCSARRAGTAASARRGAAPPTGRRAAPTTGRATT